MKLHNKKPHPNSCVSLEFPLPDFGENLRAGVLRFEQTTLWEPLRRTGEWLKFYATSQRIGIKYIKPVSLLTPKS
jgi:hypothetical protein